MKTSRWFLISTVLLVFFLSPDVFAQGGNVLYGDLIVEDDKSGELRPLNYLVILYTTNGYVLGRQTVAPNGRYRFNNLVSGEYDLAVEVENNEITRMRVQLRAPIYNTDLKQDITLGWKTAHKQPARAASITAEDVYKREPANQKLFDKAQEAADKKKYDESVTLLKQLVASDPHDFQAMTELGTVYLYQNKLADAEKAYEQSTQVRPRFFLALMNLGRVRILLQKFDDAIPILTRAVEVRAASAEANYHLGEAYLQTKKGSKAVVNFYEALRLEPVKMADAHLRLALLYNAAGMKEKAASEYEQFLKKRPDYTDRKKLELYIAANKK